VEIVPQRNLKKKLRIVRQKTWQAGLNKKMEVGVVMVVVVGVMVTMVE